MCSFITSKVIGQKPQNVFSFLHKSVSAQWSKTLNRVEEKDAFLDKEGGQKVVGKK